MNVAKFWVTAPDEYAGEAVLPAGWRRVWRGPAKPGDRHLSYLKWRENCTPNGWLEYSSEYWITITDEELGRVAPEDMWALGAETFLVLIRKDDAPGPDRGCERCQMNAEVRGERYCTGCRWKTLQENRRSR
jgi:hypothetical protein